MLICLGSFSSQALHWAKEAHELRCKLLKEHFSYTLEYPEESYTEHGEVVRNQPVCAKYFRVCTHMTIKFWHSAASFDSEGCNLTPWKVLQCYLESTLQVCSFKFCAINLYGN